MERFTPACTKDPSLCRVKGVRFLGRTPCAAGRFFKASATKARCFERASLFAKAALELRAEACGFKSAQNCDQELTVHQCVLAQRDKTDRLSSCRVVGKCMALWCAICLAIDRTMSFKSSVA